MNEQILKNIQEDELRVSDREIGSEMVDQLCELISGFLLKEKEPPVYCKQILIINSGYRIQENINSIFNFFWGLILWSCLIILDISEIWIEIMFYQGKYSKKDEYLVQNTILFKNLKHIMKICSAHLKRFTHWKNHIFAEINIKQANF